MLGGGRVIDDLRNRANVTEPINEAASALATRLHIGYGSVSRE